MAIAPVETSAGLGGRRRSLLARLVSSWSRPGDLFASYKVAMALAKR